MGRHHQAPRDSVRDLGPEVAADQVQAEIDPRGAILLLEEVHESPYRVDRMLQQLRGAGLLDGLAGLGVGDVSTCLDPRYGTCVDDVVAEINPVGAVLVSERDDILELMIGEGGDGI